MAGSSIGLESRSLSIASPQDTAVYDSENYRIEAQVTAGYGFSASGSAQYGNIGADHRSTTRQSGLFAGDGGFQVNIKEHTDLKGGIITATEAAEQNGRNRFQTATLSHSDIENHSRHQGESYGIGMSGGMSGEDLGQSQTLGGVKLYNTGAAGSGGTAGGSPAGYSQSIGFGRDGDSRSSLTKSGIGTSNLTIANDTTGEQAAAVYTAVRSETAEQNTGRLNNTFDKDRVQREIDIQREVTQQFDSSRQYVKQSIYDVVDEKRQQAEDIRRNNVIDGKNGYNTTESLRLEAEANKLEKAAFYTDVVLGGVYGWGNPDAIKYVGSAVATDPARRAATAPEQIWLVKCTQDSLYCSNTSYDGKQKRPIESERAEIGDKRQIFDITELKPGESTGVLTISNPGILNPLNDALKNAVKQNTWPTAADGIITVYNPPTPNPLSEGVYALYDKTNDLAGGRLPLTNAEKANLKLYEYAKQNNYQIDLSNHSRGGMTASVALQNANRNGLTEIPIRESRFYGTATNVQDYANQLAGKNQYSYIVKNLDGTESRYGSGAFSSVHYTDFVGRSPLLFLRSKYTVGGNEPTGGVEDKWFLYSHSSYFREVPSKYLKDNNGNYIDERGWITDKPIDNPYFDEFKKVWIDGKHRNQNQNNPSLPVLVFPIY